MKIGIYTQPLRFNYGGLLQAYALQTVLKRMGHDVVTLNPTPYIKLSPLLSPLIMGKRLLMNLCGGGRNLFYEKKKNDEFDIKFRNLNLFVEQNINTIVYEKVSDLSEYTFDAIVVGSDQVWRPKYNPLIERSFLDFTQDWVIKRIAYAASFGAENWEFTEEQTENCARLVKLFDVVSVREESGIGLCEKYLNTDATLVLDPTLLLDSSDYNSVISNGIVTTAPEGEMFCYILDMTPEKKSLIDKISNSKCLKPYTMSVYSNYERPKILKPQPSVEQWLRNIRDAEFVLTDSFHGCVFSIIFHKPFIVIANKERGIARFTSLLNQYGLATNMVFTLQDFDENRSYDIPKEAYSCLQKLRKDSMAFLLQNI